MGSDDDSRNGGGKECNTKLSNTKIILNIGKLKIVDSEV